MTFYVKESSIETSLPEGLGEGLFTSLFIPKGTVIMQFSNPKRSKINDPKADLTQILQANDDESFYQAVLDFKIKYLESGEDERVNLMIVVLCGIKCLVTTKEIQPDEEFFRAYGYKLWICELGRIVNDSTRRGYLRIVREEIEDGGTVDEMEKLNECLWI